MAEEGRDVEEQMVGSYKVKGKEEILNETNNFHLPLKFLLLKSKGRDHQNRLNLQNFLFKSS